MKPLFKINPGSKVTGTGRGVIYVTTTPVHPHGIKMKEHKVTYIPKQIVVMENHLGRMLELSKGEEVHHKDGNPKNNALSNLILKTHSEHQKEHALKEKRWEKSKFWKHSPRTKPRKVAQLFLEKVQGKNP